MDEHQRGAASMLPKAGIEADGVIPPLPTEGAVAGRAAAPTATPPTTAIAGVLGRSSAATGTGGGSSSSASPWPIPLRIMTLREGNTAAEEEPRKAADASADGVPGMVPGMAAAESGPAAAVGIAL